MQNPSDETLAAYLAGQSTAAEAASVEAWVGESSENAVALGQLNEMWALAEPENVPVLDESFARKLSQRVAADVASSGSVVSVHKTVKSWGRWSIGTSPLAALIGIAVGTAASVVVFFNTSFTNWISSPETTAPTEYSTANAQRATLRLPDGTKVTLNVASRLLVPRDFGNTTREVTLLGHGSFNVSQNMSHPFIVKTAQAVTTVLGTEFSVRAYSEDPVAHIAVKSGKVSVGPSRVTVDAGTVAIAGTAGVEVEHAENIVDAEMSFEHGVLTLNAVPLSDAVTSLNRWYNIDVQIPDASLGKLRLTAQLSDRSVDDFVNSLTAAFPVQTERHGRTLTVRRNSSTLFKKSSL